MARSFTICLAVLAGVAGALGGSLVHGQAVLLDFTSATCPPCEQMRPVVERLAARGYQVRAVDVRREAAAARQYRITATPTFVVMVAGREHARIEGVVSDAQLAEMMDRAAGTPARGDVNLAANVAPATASQTFAQGPTPDRVVEIQQPVPRAVAEGRQRAASAAAPAAGDRELAARLVAATVRLSIQDPGGRSTGTGVIIDSRSGEALVLTCGHLFRESAGKGAIEISTFTPGPAGAEQPRPDAPRGRCAGCQTRWSAPRRTSAPCGAARPAHAAPARAR
jgi:thiol-disulfide isomerase/thioredoxin